MKLDIYQVDAFTSDVFKGNPAAVVPLSSWLSDEVLCNIAAENNLSETAFFVPNSDGSFHLRWFTPTVEVDLCGHATLAASWVLFNELNFDQDKITFQTMSGELIVEKQDEGITLNFPVWESYLSEEISDDVLATLSTHPVEFYKGKKWVAVVENADTVRNFDPDFDVIKAIPSQGFIITAQHDDSEYDIISRYFGPQLGINEDPVTGSAHCILVPIWAEKLGRNRIKAYQASSRGGSLDCALKGDRLYIKGTAALYMKGQIYV